ncbi:T9SS type A sorting domain-containing protein [candidate division KSB1 bacterium]|nr:T9SS type A sorting domain-containing protein [candidate division KSB1 bacterium]
MNNRNLALFGLLGVFFVVGIGHTQIEAIWPNPMLLDEPYFVDQDTTVDVSSLNLGVAAGNQTWVFADTMTGEITQSGWLEVEGTPYDTAFTEADWVEHFIQYAPLIEFNVREDWKITVPAQLVEMFRYHRQEEGWIRTLGMGFTYDLMWGAPYVYDAPSFFYPETLTASTDPWLEMYSFETKLLALFPSTVTDSTWIEVDAWGELTIPAGTFDCIRIKRHEFRNIYIAAFDTSARLETYTYTWFTQDFQPLLSISAQATRGDTIEVADLVSRSQGFRQDTTSGVCDPESCRQISNLHPDGFELSQNYPNPFNPVTTIQFSLSAPARVRMDVIDVRGRQVDQIQVGYRAEGTYEMTWDGSNLDQGVMSSGIYYYRITAEPISGAAPYSQTRKMILLQ